MVDLSSSSANEVGRAGSPPAPGAATRPSRDDALVAIVELLFFAYRDFTHEADAVLEQFGFGRAHHRVLHFVNRKPGMRVADLLDVLQITKQSLARVLKERTEKPPVNVWLYWIDYYGRRSYYGSLSAGSTTEPSTFAGHLWVVADIKGKDIARFVATAKPGHARIKAP